MTEIKSIQTVAVTAATAKKKTAAPGASTAAKPPATPAVNTPTEKLQTTARQGSAQTTQSLFNDTAPVTKAKAPAKPKTPTATETLLAMAQKYGVTIPAGESMTQHQPAIVKAMVTAIAAKHDVPANVALGVSGHESGGWKMWQNVDKGLVVKGANLSSTDWGVMQINDGAHPKAFPRAKKDIEYNIEYGIKFLAEQHKRFSGSLNLGFGDWDKTLAAYNLGHSPSKSELPQAKQYIKGIKRYAGEEMA